MSVISSKGATVWLTGLSGAGKSTVAAGLQELLEARDMHTFALDGDFLREGLNADLGYGEQDRLENVRRLGEVALLFARVGFLSIVSAISPYTAGRSAVRERHESNGVGFVEIHVATPLEVCEARDPKGLYARARRGEIPSFTGVSAPYEVPESPDLALSTVGSPHEAVLDVVVVLEKMGLLG
jgi:adenylyl-sulfate kinase